MATVGIKELVVFSVCS